LPKPVQDLICMILDEEKMKQAMLEFELDLEKMPLGKLSKQQISNAYSVLNELSELIAKPINNVKLLDATNRFYTLVPHNFGISKPPLIDNEELIKTKMDMLEALLDIEVAYYIISTKNNTDDVDPIDHCYAKLNADIKPLDKSSDEYKVIEKYVKNTHAATHSSYTLDIIDVLCIDRHGESERYNKYKSLDNRMLLWHGSRVTNFAGILSQGLRIAPPEAPVTGYMFGKGIYFADMVSKSANYCADHLNNNIGLLLLSEVAIGNP
jgi:poly [ADP-ribose] polymerase 1